MQYKVIPLILTMTMSTLLIKAQDFQLERDTIITTQPITVAVYYKENIYCLDEHGNLLTIDKKSKTMVEHPIRIRLKSMYSQRDSMFATDSSNNLYHYTNSRLIHIKGRSAEQLLYEDENYLIKGTCMGEWGGSIHFIDSKTGITAGEALHVRYQLSKRMATI